MSAEPSQAGRAPSRKHEILSQMRVYTFSSQATQLITVVAGILTRNFLGTVQMGMWSTLQIVLEYSKYSTLGTTEAIAREIPYYQGKGRHERVAEIRDLVCSFALLTSTLTALGIAFYAAWQHAAMPEPLFRGLLVLAAIVVLQRVNNLMVSLLRAYRKFSLAGSQLLASSVVNALLVGVLTWKFKIYGFMAATALSFVFNIFYMGLQEDFRFHFRFGRRILRLIAFGLPLMILGAAATILYSVDRIVILNQALGLYSVPLMALHFLTQLSNAMGIVMIPHFHAKFGERDRPEDLRGYLEKADEGLSGIMPWAIGPAWILSRFVITRLMPEYAASVPAAQILCAGSFFAALVLPYGNFIIAIKKHLIMLPIMAATIGLSALLHVAAVRLGYGIEGVAFTTSLTFFTHYLWLYLIAARSLYRRRQRFQHVARTVGRFLLMTSLLVCLNRTPGMRGHDLYQLAIYVLVYLPSGIQLNRQFHIIKWPKSKPTAS
jgi:O-antigen/teichoic acid export membrane protein